MCAGETLTMPWFVLVGYATAGDDLVTLDTPSCKLVFITLSAKDFLFTGDEALSSNWDFAYATAETFLVPLSGLIFHFLSPSSEDFMAPIASRSKLFIVATSAVDAVSFGTKLLVNQ